MDYQERFREHVVEAGVEGKGVDWCRSVPDTFRAGHMIYLEILRVQGDITQIFKSIQQSLAAGLVEK